MGTPYFNRDESVMMTAHKVKFESALSDVMLTNQRLILIDAGYAQFTPHTIPLLTVETVISGEDAYGNPIITLSLAPITPGGATQPKDLVFCQKTSGERMQERNDWVKQLKKQISSVRQKASTPVAADEDTDIIFDDTVEFATAGAPGPAPSLTDSAPLEPVMASSHKDVNTGEASPGDVVSEEPVSGEPGPAPETGPVSKTPLSSRFHPEPVSPVKSKFIPIAAIIIVILAVAGGVFIYVNNLHAASPEPIAPVTTLPVTTAGTPAETPVPTIITPDQTPVQTGTTLPPALPAVIIPGSGVWVGVQYAGSFTGQVGVSGGMQTVSGSGEKFYQIPTVDGVVEAAIQKQDGSGDPLTVEIYKNGILIKSSTITAPRGTIDIHVDLKTG
jgi:hypothetical protein